MKRISNILICAVAVIMTGSCMEHESLETAVMNDEIVLEFSSAMTKATTESTGKEAFLSHVDVMIFNYGNNAPTSLVYHERIAVNGADESVLGARRSDFSENTGYYVQVVANSTESVDFFKGISDYSDLENAKQRDTELHITGLDLPMAPTNFLMDGVAYSGSSRPDVPGTVILNNGIPSDNTELTVTLERAAAKIEIIINAGGETGEFDLTFMDGLAGSAGASYYIRNLPYETFVLDHDPVKTTPLMTTSKTSNSYFDWNPVAAPKKVTLVAYAYAHDWSGQSLLEKEPCVVVNLPFRYEDIATGTSHDHPNSWYKIPMSADDRFDRNMYYRVEVTVNRAGATTMLEPVEIEGIRYNVSDWSSVEIEVGDANRPNYLYVNEETMQMNNISEDSSTLEFASSSALTAEIDKVWFIDKFGAEKTITGTDHGIVITPDEGLNGNITVYSPVPTNNTIRYITFTVTNETGDSHTVTVTQYPLEYITNTLSYYSYRSDFLQDDATGTVTAKHYENRTSYRRFSAVYNGSLSYASNNSGFFVSKYVASTYTSGNNKGLSTVNYYTANNRDEFNSNYNARMYHIRIMASSGSYVVGKAKITNGITDPGEDNSRLVSPSFMIASRLGTLTTGRITVDPSRYMPDDLPSRPVEPDPEDFGATRGLFGGWRWPAGSDQAGYNAAVQQYETKYEEYMDAYEAAEEEAEIKAMLDVYAEHCKQYVEVYDPDNDSRTDNSVHYNDWRLPTKAELEIIYKFQGSDGSANADAIDYLLNAAAYYSASGPVFNPNPNSDGSGGHSVRCIRDAY